MEVDTKPTDLVIQEKPNRKDFNFYRCDRNDPDVEYLRAYYGFDESFPCDQLVTQHPAEMKTVKFMTDSMSDFLYADHEHKLNIISVGVTVFIKNQSKMSTNSECIYRVC
jgi:hypothetical protein